MGNGAEVLRPTSLVDEHQTCPDCGTSFWKIVGGRQLEI
jgi:hypothetical protein